MTAVDGEVTLYGVFSLGPAEVALPLSELREVIPRPSTFETLPISAPGLVGAVNLRHLVIPILDLRRLDGMESGGEGEAIVIVAHDGYVFGLLAGEIRGVVRVPDSALFETTVSERSPLFSHSFERPDNAAVVSVLDCHAIAALPGAPRVRDVAGPKESGPARPVEGAGPQRMIMLLRSGALGLCIDVTHVHSVVPQLIIKDSTLAGGACRGVVELDGYAVPAVDLLELLGLGLLPADQSHRGIALHLPRGLIVLTVSEVSSIQALPDNGFVELPPFGMPRPDLLFGIVDLPGAGQHLMIDGEAVKAQPNLDAIAGLAIPLAGTVGQPSTVDSVRDGDEVDGREIVESVRPFLTYNVGHDAATPLMQISEIVPYPSDLIPVDGGPLKGFFVHRRTSVPLLCLGTLLGQYDVDRTGANVLLVDVDGGLVGFIVPTLRAIEESIWEERAQGTAKSGEDLLRSGPLVKVGRGAQARMIPNIDLHRLARQAA